MTDRKINVVIIHGIGKNQPGYAKPLIEGVERSFKGHLRKYLNSDIDTEGKIVFQEVVWDDILGKNQEQLKKIFEQEFKRRRKEAAKGAFKRIALLVFLTALFLFVIKSWSWRILFTALALVFSLGKKILIPLRTKFAAEYINDIIGYRNKEAYRNISSRIDEYLAKFNPGQEREPVTFVAHSLGTVIGSDFIYDRQKDNKQFHQNLCLWNFFTIGSPLVLFALQFGPELFKNPIHLEDEKGRWINLLDADDVIAYPLRPLNQAYEAAVHRDAYVESGLLGVAHIRYWNTKQVHEIIGKKLAIDWLAINQKLPAEKLSQLYADYDKRR